MGPKNFFCSFQNFFTELYQKWLTDDVAGIFKQIGWLYRKLEWFFGEKIRIFGNGWVKIFRGEYFFVSLIKLKQTIYQLIALDAKNTKIEKKWKISNFLKFWHESEKFSCFLYTFFNSNGLNTTHWWRCRYFQANWLIFAKDRAVFGKKSEFLEMGG